MKVSRLPIARLALGTIASIGLSLILAQPSRAGEPVGPNPLQDVNPLEQNDNNPFSRNSNGAASVFDLINRITLSNGRSAEDYSSEQNADLSDAVTQFRAKQQTRLQGKTPTTPVTPVTTP